LRKASLSHTLVIVRVWLLPIFGFLPACTAISGFSDLEKAEFRRGADSNAVGDADLDDSSANETAVPDTTTVDDAPIATDTAKPDTTPPSDAPAFTCPSGTKGPTMVNVGGFCIDSTEVTTAQYGAFLVTKGTDVSGQPAECSWNTSYTPLFWPQTGLETHPVMGVDWCDAKAYCAWAGKRLCGQIGGGATPFATPASATASQWYAACSMRGGKTYPYGASYVAAACQDGTIKPPRTVPAGTKLSCDGGYSGVFDMSGEIQEWEDSCNGTAGTSALCHVRGGMIYDSTPADLACASPRTLTRETKNDHTGFRCCSP
jgi:formylglycine-generating enzyme